MGLDQTRPPTSSEYFPSPMRQKIHVALLVSGGLEPEAGGAYSAERSFRYQLEDALRPGDILTVVALEKASSKEARASELDPSMFVWKRTTWRRLLEMAYRSPLLHRAQRRGHFIPKNGLEAQLLHRGVNLVVQASPSMAILDWQTLPSWATFWDLGHRDLPEFPEVAQSRIFEHREKSYRRSLIRASRIIAESEESCKKLTLTYGLRPEKLMVAHLVPDLREDSNSSQADRDPKLAFYPAQFWPHKNHVVLLYALKRLIDTKRQPRHLILTGSDKGNEEHIRQLARELDVEAYITFAGFASFEQIKDLYRTVGVTVMPSVLGPTNLPPLEALVMGCPVAATFSADSISLCETGVAHMEPFDVEGWAHILDASTQLPAPEQDEVVAAIGTRRQANVNRLAKALDEFALLRALWAPNPS
jgi:glycosyltransferase involved in cell wall biosynthesis